MKKRYPTGCWPTPAQKLLLEACLLEGQRARDAWARWRDSEQIDGLDGGSLRLLPLLRHNLRLLGEEDLPPSLGRVYRQTWSGNRFLERQAVQMMGLLEEAGIPTMLLKGAALVQLYYLDPGLRPMGDVDVLVPTADAGRALRVLERAGFLPKRGAWDPKTIPGLTFSSGTPVRGSNGLSIDLHWHVFQEFLSDDADDAFWSAAVPISLGEIRTRALCPADQLLHCVVHGLNWKPSPSIRWIADATMILKSTSAIDWSRLLSQSRERQVVWMLRRALRFLRDNLAAPVPAAFLGELERAPINTWERVELSIRESRLASHRLGSLQWLWFRYLRLQTARSRWQLPGGFLEFLRIGWQLESRWKVPGFAVAKAVETVRALWRQGR